jgi:8-oxo-dGTP pyrophosphatase MutT (NUDIX family)
MTTPQMLRERLRRRFAGTEAGTAEKEPRLAGLPPELATRFRHLFPLAPAAAAVLVPIIERPAGLTVLFTERAAGLKHHPGQISFPGGRMEADDGSPLQAALRETQEEIGLDRRHIDVLGYLPDHLIISGYRVTPVVGLVQPDFELRLDPTEVVATFEVPLTYLLDPANHGARQRSVAGHEFEVYDIPWESRHIWGATAGMLMSLYRHLRE